MRRRLQSDSIRIMRLVMAMKAYVEALIKEAGDSGVLSEKGHNSDSDDDPDVPALQRRRGQSHNFAAWRNMWCYIPRL
jgi:hypothetical protein